MLQNVQETTSSSYCDVRHSCHQQFSFCLSWSSTLTQFVTLLEGGGEKEKKRKRFLCPEDFPQGGQLTKFAMCTQDFFHNSDKCVCVN